MGAVFFTLILLTGNTMAQAVRERIPELAVLKTIGFSNRSVLLLVLAESMLLIVLGGAVGPGGRRPGRQGAQPQHRRGAADAARRRGRSGREASASMLLIGLLVGCAAGASRHAPAHR